MALLGQFKRDTLANWRNNNTVLADGEFALVASDSNNPKKYDYWVVGDGITAFSGLVMGELANSTGITGITSEQGNSGSLAASQRLVTTLVNAGYIFKGVATPGELGTMPGISINQKIFYLVGSGSYPNFGSSNFSVEPGYIGFLEYNGENWQLETIKINDVDYVRYVAQSLTEEQKAIVRSNLDIPSNNDVNNLSLAIQNLTNKFGNFVVLSEDDYNTLVENEQVDAEKFYFITEE